MPIHKISIFLLLVGSFFNALTMASAKTIFSPLTTLSELYITTCSKDSFEI